jgi:ADP-ribosyl-[dinitrogen reductase] hydrolase
MEQIQFDSMDVDGFHGEIVFTRFPGRSAGDEFSLARLDAVFQALIGRGCLTLVSLAEDEEFEGFCGKSVFAERISQYGFAWRHLPIRDFQIPDAVFLDAWPAVSSALLEELRLGRDVCLHCMGGIGRSGTIAALLLIDHGVGNEEAIVQVRQARKGAIETDEQEAFVRSYQSA